MYTQCIHTIYRFFSFHIHFDSSRVVVRPGIMHDCHKLRPPRTEAGNPNPTRFWRPLGGNFRDFSASERKHVPWRMNTMVAPDDRERGEVEVDLKTLNIGWVVVWFGTGSDW